MIQLSIVYVRSLYCDFRYIFVYDVYVVLLFLTMSGRLIFQYV